MFLTKVVEKIKPQFYVFFFVENVMFVSNKEKYCKAGQVIDDNMAHSALHAGYLRLQTHTQDM
jgi:hypothetical protein